MKRMLLFFIFPVISVWGQPLRLETIHLYGNNRTKSHIILQELHLQEGSPISDSLLINDRLWLLRQDFLRRIEFQIKPGSSVEQRHLLLVVQEKSAWAISPIFNINDLFGWYEGALLTFRNIWGKRNRFDVHVQLGGIQKFSLTWSNPWKKHER